MAEVNAQKWIDCTTQIKKQDYQMAESRGAITDGLSEEAIGYVNEAVGRTQEDKYSIFDKETGLMPEFGGFDGHLYLGKDNMVELEAILGEDGEETGLYQSADGRVLVDYDYETNGYKISYDSDGVNGFDRTATYEYFSGVGTKKTEETFDADGDGVNEVVLGRDYELVEREKGELYEIDNPDKNWWNPASWFAPDKVNQIRYREDNKLMATEVRIGVNADDMGSHTEKKETNLFGMTFSQENKVEHFEFVETNSLAGDFMDRDHYIEEGSDVYSVENQYGDREISQTDIYWPNATNPNGMLKEDREI